MFIINDEIEHPLYRKATKAHSPYFDFISYDNSFLVELSETSDNRPYLSSDTHTDNPYYDETTTSQDEQTETFHDPQEPINDTHPTTHVLLEQTQQNQNTLFLKLYQLFMMKMIQTSSTLILIPIFSQLLRTLTFIMLRLDKLNTIRKTNKLLQYKMNHQQ